MSLMPVKNWINEEANSMKDVPIDVGTTLIDPGFLGPELELSDDEIRDCPEKEIRFLSASFRNVWHDELKQTISRRTIWYLNFILIIITP